MQIRGKKTIEMANGCHWSVTTYSFAVVMTQIGGDQVKAVRIDDEMNQYRARKKAEEENPGWRTKSILGLYEEDFEDEKEES